MDLVIENRFRAAEACRQGAFEDRMVLIDIGLLNV